MEDAQCEIKSPADFAAWLLSLPGRMRKAPLTKSTKD
jgi:hypothetical protein